MAVRLEICQKEARVNLPDPILLDNAKQNDADLDIGS